MMNSSLAPPPHDECVFTGPVRVSGPRILDEICRFRARAWTADDGVAEHAFPDGKWHDRFDLTALHWIVRDQAGSIVAAARLNLHDRLEDVDEWEVYQRWGLRVRGRIAMPARVVVCPSARGRGLALRMLDAQDDAAREADASCALRQASEAMARLLVGRGWQMLGPASSDPRFPGVKFQVACIGYQMNWRM